MMDDILLAEINAAPVVLMENFSLEKSKKIIVSCVIDAEKTPVLHPPALVNFVFRNRDGGVVDHKIPELSYSEKLSGFACVGKPEQCGRVSFRLTLSPPSGAARVSAALYCWHDQNVKVVEPLACAIRQPLGPLLGQTEIVTHGAVSLMLSVFLSVSDQPRPDKPALVTLAFFDGDGVQLEGPFFGLNQSDLYGAFLYINDQSGAADEFACVKEIALPPGTARVRAETFAWNAKSVELLEPMALGLTEAKPERADEKTLGTVDAAVTEGETYEVVLRWTGTQAAQPRFAVLIPCFEDADGVEVAPPAYLPVSQKIGSYRYFSPPLHTNTTESGQCAVASVIAPAGAVRLRGTARIWDAQDNFGTVTLTVQSLTGPTHVCAEGWIDLRLPFPSEWEACFAGEVLPVGAPCQQVGVVEVVFQDSTGAPLLEYAPGLQVSAQFLNFIPLRPQQRYQSIRFQAVFRPPPNTRRVLWRLRPAPQQLLKPMAEFAFKRYKPSIGAAFAALPSVAKQVGDLLADERDLLRMALPEKPFWHNLFRGAAVLLGEVLHSVSEQGWMAVSSTLALPRALPATARLAIHPVYFNDKGCVLACKTLTGCTEHPELGLLRYATGTGLAAGEVSFGCAFLTPPGAAFAAFYLVGLGEQIDAVLTQLSAQPVDPDAVHADLDTTDMDSVQLQQEIQVAEQTRDIAARQTLASALACCTPKDQKLAQRAQRLRADTVDLAPHWLPTLPLQSVHTPDPLAVLHLFKVIYPDESTGGAVRGTAIVEAQAARDLRPAVCMPLNSPRPDQQHRQMADGIEEVARNGVRIFYPYYAGFERKQLAPADLLSLETVLWNRVLRQTRTGLIHAASGFRGYENALKGIALARANRVPLVYEVRSFHEHTWRPVHAPQMSNRLTAWRMAQEDRCMAAADAVVTISQAMVDNLHARGVPEDRLFFVPNAIDPAFETLPSRGEVACLRHKLGLLGKTTLGYISNFSQREGHQVLLDAYTQLLGRGHDLHLVLVGDGPERQKIIDTVKQRKLEHRVRLPGNVDHADIRTWYHTIDLFVVPRIADFAADYVTPLKPFEAMSQGIPLIMSERLVTAEIAGSRQQRAAVFPAGDVHALVELIEAELANPARLLERAAQARDWVLAERVWAAVVQRYEPVYEAARRFHASRLPEQSAQLSARPAVARLYGEAA